MESEGYSSDEGGVLGAGFQLVAAEKIYDVPAGEVQRMMDDMYALDPHTRKLFSRKYIEFLMSKPMRKLPDQVRSARRAWVAAFDATEALRVSRAAPCFACACARATRHLSLTCSCRCAQFLSARLVLCDHRRWHRRSAARTSTRRASC